MSQRTCSIEGCESTARGHGWCSKHYQRWWKHGDPVGPEPEIVEFERLVLAETDDHVLWPGRVNVHGYGYVRRTYGTHRLALLRRGPAPIGRVEACHRRGFGCPKTCMNYRHLYWGSHAENMADMVADGTSLRGERQPNHVLTEVDVREIRRLRATTSLTYVQIADSIGANWLTVRSAAIGQSWGWLK